MKILLIILSLYFTSVNAQGLYLPVYVIAAQSNGEGGDTDTAGTPIEAKRIFQNALMAVKLSGSITQPDIVIQPLQYGVNNNFRTPLLKFGPETGIAYYDSARKIGIIKYCYAGSMLHDKKDGKLDRAGHWMIDAIPQDGPIHYHNLIYNWIIPSLSAYRNLGYDPHIIKVIWIQGEADSQVKVAANNYQVNTINLFNQTKTDIAPYDSSILTAKFIITQTRSDFPGDWVLKVITAKRNVDSIYNNTCLIESDFFNIANDHIHYTRWSQFFQQGKQIVEK